MVWFGFLAPFKIKPFFKIAGMLYVKHYFRFWRDGTRRGAVERMTQEGMITVL